MKNILLATTALVLSAGVAAAEVAVSGDGRMGVAYNGSEMNFASRARVKFTLSGETDGGLGFGASFRAHDAGGAAAGTKGSIYVSGAFGKIAMGDVVSAPEELLGDLPEVGFTDLGNNDIPYLTGDNSGVLADGSVSGSNMLYTYSTGAISLAASMSDGKNGAVDVSQEYALAAAYAFGNYTVGLGYEVLDADALGKATMMEIGGVAHFGDTSVKAYYGKGSDIAKGAKVYGLGVESKFGATAVKAFYQVSDMADLTNATAIALKGNAKVASYGIGAEYDLGGGASVAGGIADNDVAGSKAVYDLGLKFKF